MRNFLCLTLALTLMPALTPASAWVPKLDDQTAKSVIDVAYGRATAPLPTYLMSDLTVQDGKFKSGDGAVKVFDGGDACLSGWLGGDAAQGSHPISLTLSGQADQLAFQAAQARDSFKTLTAQQALADSASRLPDGQLRLDFVVAGLPTQDQRRAYNVRLQGPDGKLLTPVRFGYVNDWKQDAGGKWGGTIAYYFEPLKAGLNANDKVSVLFRNEVGSCAYAVPFDLAAFY